MNVAAVRQALADALASVSDNANPYVLAQPTPPGFQIIPPGTPTPHYTMGPNGLEEREFVIQGFVALNSDIGAQMVLDEWCSGLVTAAVEADKTLGGLVSALVVSSQTPGRQVEQPPGNPMLLVEWHVLIYG